MWRRPDHLVVGAGFFGAVVAERLASHGRKVLVIDRRAHVGGNSWSTCDEATGIEYHPYGVHIFHTSNPKVMTYLRRFATLNDYRHRAAVRVGEREYPFPVNLDVINAFFGENLSPDQASAFIAEKTRPFVADTPRNLEEKALAMVGRELYETFIRGYTTKHWGCSPTMLPANIITRLPLRFDRTRDYFQRCRWQGIPREGYAELFTRILAHPNLRVETGVDFREVAGSVRPRRETVYSGPIDSYFNGALGALGWRSVEFRHEVLEAKQHQATATVHFAEESVPHTRVHEPKHYHFERLHYHQLERTLVISEYPLDNPLEPYYPVRTAENVALLQRYRAMAKQDAPEVVFGGRLGDYAYLDMDMTIASALACARSLLTRPGGSAAGGSGGRQYAR